jgi:hypothetical protein
VPIDNPATHLELTMIHEAMILEYSGRHLALIEWAASLKLYAYSCLGLALFFPWGIAQGDSFLGLLLAIPVLLVKLAIGGALLAGIETINAKVRIFRAPEFLGTAFCWRCSGLLVRLLLETSGYECFHSPVRAAHQPVRLGDPAAGLRHAGAAAGADADQPVRPAGLTLCPVHPGGGRHHRAEPPLLVGRPDAGCSRRVLLPWILHRLVRRLEVKWDVEPSSRCPPPCWSASPSS